MTDLIPIVAVPLGSRCLQDGSDVLLGLLLVVLGGNLDEWYGCLFEGGAFDGISLDGVALIVTCALVLDGKNGVSVGINDEEVEAFAVDRLVSLPTLFLSAGVALRSHDFAHARLSHYSMPGV